MLGAWLISQLSHPVRQARASLVGKPAKEILEALESLYGPSVHRDVRQDLVTAYKDDLREMRLPSPDLDQVEYAEHIRQYINQVDLIQQRLTFLGASSDATDEAIGGTLKRNISDHEIKGYMPISNANWHSIRAYLIQMVMQQRPRRGNTKKRQKRYHGESSPSTSRQLSIDEKCGYCLYSLNKPQDRVNHTHFECTQRNNKRSAPQPPSNSDTKKQKKGKAHSIQSILFS
jgi:hypothetical protein